MNDLIGSDGALGPENRRTLYALLDTIIPASTGHGVPGAGDESIAADVIASAGSLLGFIDESMTALNDLARDDQGAVYPDLEVGLKLRLAERFRANRPDAMGMVVALACQCYYRDARVMESLGVPPGPPFPEGHEIDQGDWSLLDPVRARAPFYRKSP